MEDFSPVDGQVRLFPPADVAGGMAETASTPMDLHPSVIGEQEDDLSSRHTLPEVVHEDTLRPPSPMPSVDTHKPLTWWFESDVGER